jgi:hypothetical protein
MPSTNDVSEPAESYDPQRRAGLFENVATYIRNLTFPNREILSDHAIRTPHEDVPEEAVRSHDLCK